MSNILEFNDKQHEYLLLKKKIPSVTQILAPISKMMYAKVDDWIINRKAKIGSRVHKLIEMYNKYNLLPTKDEEEDVLKYFEQYLEFEKSIDSIVFDNEFKSFYSNNDMVFAGTIDNIRLLNNAMVLIDYKTVANLNEVLLSLQLYGYKLIAEQTLNIKIDEFKALSLKKDSFKLVDFTKEVNNIKTKELFEKMYEWYKLLEFHNIKVENMEENC